MENWRMYFEPHILERGKNYYDENFVYNLKQTKNGYKANVEGTWDYTVKIKISNHKIREMDCTCPYADEGNYCKHMAAVLFKLENEHTQLYLFGQEEETKLSEPSMEQALKNVISHISEEELRKLLLQLAQEDNSLASHILTQYSDKCGKEEINFLKNEVDEICEKYSDRYGFISYRNAMDFTEELEDFLYEKVETLVDKGFFMEAFEITNHVFHCIGNQDMDDSAGGSCMVMGICYDTWERILQEADSTEEEIMFRWFMEHRKGYVADYAQEYIEEILMVNFKRKEMLIQKMALLDDEIKQMAKAEKKGLLSLNYHELQDLVIKRIVLMEELECSLEEIEKYSSKHRNFPRVRSLEVERYLEHKQYQKAIKVLEESKEIEKNYPGYVSEYSEQLIKIYAQIGDKENYKKELIYRIFSIYQKDLEYIKKLKKAVPKEDWSEWKHKILTSGNTTAVKYAFMESEGMYEELLNEIIKSGSVYLLGQYEKTLKTKFPEKICEFYVAYMKKLVKSVSNRKQYQELVQYLKKIATYPSGNKKAQELADEWKREYHKRPAMMDEIKKAGF